MLEILAVCGSQGGGGKTTTSVNLVYASAAARWQSPLWDLDPQGAATYILQGRSDTQGGLKKLLKGRRQLPKIADETDNPGLDLVPAKRSNHNIAANFMSCGLNGEGLALRS